MFVCVAGQHPAGSIHVSKTDEHDSRNHQAPVCLHCFSHQRSERKKAPFTLIRKFDLIYIQAKRIKSLFFNAFETSVAILSSSVFVRLSVLCC